MKGDDLIYCEECFQYERHKGHMFSFVENCGDGFCDCGNSSVLSPDSFCSKHKNPEPLKLMLPEIFQTTKEELHVVLSIVLSLSSSTFVLRAQVILMEHLNLLLTKLCTNSQYYQKALT